MGSDSDLPKIKECFDILDEFQVDFEVIISSAHRCPARTMEWSSTASQRGIKVIIAAAGGAAHLPGVVASHTTLPVIGVPIETAVAGGLDSMLSIIQMPAGIPVAAMAAGKAGGVNAALFAMSILALSDGNRTERLLNYRKTMAEKIAGRNEQLKKIGLKEYIKSKEAGT